MVRRLLGGASLLAAIGCIHLPPPLNPERKACSDACVQAKNTCLIAATTARAIEGCDAQHHACAAPCQAMPVYAGEGWQ